MTQKELVERTFLLAFKQDPRSDILAKISPINGEACIPIEVTNNPLGYYCETIERRLYYVTSNQVYLIYSWFNGRLALKNPFPQESATDYK